MKAFLLGRGLVSTMVRDIHCLSIDVISLVSNTWLSAFLYLQCNPKTFFMSALWKRIKHSYALKFDTEAAKRFWNISDSDCIVSIGERAPALQQLGKESSHCSGGLSAHLCPKLVHLPFLVSFSSSSSSPWLSCRLTNVHHLSTLEKRSPKLALYTSSSPSLFILSFTPPLIPACWQDNAHGFIGHLQKLPHAALSSTSQIQAPQYQIQIQLLLLLMPTKIVPNPKGVNQLRTLSHLCFGFILKPQCFLFPPSSYQQFSPICRLSPISSHFLRHLTSSPLFPL